MVSGMVLLPNFSHSITAFVFSQWKDGQKWMFLDLKQLDFLLSLKDESFKLFRIMEN